MPGKDLRSLLHEQDILVSPGVYDCYSARLAEMASFRLVSTTGAGLVNSRLGYPDVGIFSLRNNVDACRSIARSVDIPHFFDVERRFMGPSRTLPQTERTE